MLVEATLTLPIIFILLAAIIQFGYAYAVLITLQNASVAAARTAVLNTGKTSSEVCDVARVAVASMVDPLELVCTTVPESLPVSPDTVVTVALSYSMPLLFSGGISGFDGPWNLQVRAVMQ